MANPRGASQSLSKSIADIGRLVAVGSVQMLHRQIRSRLAGEVGCNVVCVLCMGGDVEMEIEALPLGSRRSLKSDRLLGGKSCLPDRKPHLSPTLEDLLHGALADCVENPGAQFGREMVGKTHFSLKIRQA